MKNPLAVVLAVVTLSVSVESAIAAPDVTPWQNPSGINMGASPDITFSGPIQDGVPIQVSVEVFNRGSTALDTSLNPLEVHIGGNAGNITTDADASNDTKIIVGVVLAPGDSTIVSFTWTPLATDPATQIQVFVDPFNHISESDEGNNATFRDFSFTNPDVLFFDFNDNQLPAGWTQVAESSPWSQAYIQNGRMEAWPTDHQLRIRYAITTPVTSISVRFRGEVRNTFWGSVNAVSFSSNSSSVGLRQLNEEFDASDGVNENHIRLSYGVGLHDAILIPETFPTWEYELTLVGSAVTGKVKNTSTGQEYVFNQTAPFSAEDVVSMQLKVAHTTNPGPTWIDDVELTPGEPVQQNEAPTAVAGLDQAVRAGDTVLLDGSASFDDNTASGNLDYSWGFASKPALSNAVLTGDDTPSPSFTVDVPGTYTVQLIVTDELGLASTPDDVVISSDNLAPTADAGIDQLVIVGSIVALDGSGSSDPETDALSFDWSITQAPPGSNASLTGGNTVAPSFVPDLVGNYEVSLTVSDFIGPGAPDTTSITATSAEDFAEIKILDANDVVSSLGTGDVTTRGNQRAFTNFLMQAVVAIQDGDSAKAVDKLEKAIERTDGCIVSGVPDGNGPGRDWITNCSDQEVVYALLDAALAALTP